MEVLTKNHYNYIFWLDSDIKFKQSKERMHFYILDKYYNIKKTSMLGSLLHQNSNFTGQSSRKQNNRTFKVLTNKNNHEDNYTKLYKEKYI